MEPREQIHRMGGCPSLAKGTRRSDRGWEAYQRVWNRP